MNVIRPLFIVALLIGLLVAGSATAQAQTDVDDAQASEAESRQQIRVMVHAAVREVANDREAWLLASMLEFWVGPGRQQASGPQQAADRMPRNVLRTRALSAQARDPVLMRMVLNGDGSRDSAPERVRALLAKLETLDPGNAFNSLAVMHLAPKDPADPIYDQFIQEMASADHYRSDYLPALRASFAALARPHGLAEYPGEAQAQDHASEWYQASLAASSIAAALALPNYDKLMRACAIDQYPDRSESCQRIGERMFNDADILMDRLIALAVLERSATDAVARMRLQALRRESDWQMAAYHKLMFSAMGSAAQDTQQSTYFATMLRRGEVAAMHELLAAHAIPLQPPTDWNKDD